MTTKNVLTAAEGAEPVAKRWRKRRRRAERDDDQIVFTCEGCGGHQFSVEHRFDRAYTRITRLECTCKNGEEEAGLREYQVTESYYDMAPLSDGADGEKPHVPLWEFGVGTDLVFEDEEFLEEQISCESCVEDSFDDQWDVEVDEPEDTNHDLCVVCDECGHEIEFGYSHPPVPEPIHGGRIWPCESSDFNPWMCFPDRKYREHWQKLNAVS